jgi:hypothetical protein
MRLAVLAVFPFLLGIAQAQTLSVAPEQLDFKMPVGGPLPPVTTFTITASGDWTITANGDYYGLSLAKGTGNATVTVTPADYWPVGSYKSDIAVTSGGITRTIAGTKTVDTRKETN